jgi:hypothetical protein
MKRNLSLHFLLLLSKAMFETVVTTPRLRRRKNLQEEQPSFFSR